MARPPAYANAPAKGSKPKSAKEPKPVAGIERGDHVYVQHPKLGAMAVEVLASGKHGFTGACDKGGRHKLEWPAYLGHKARMLGSYNVADQGADGVLLEDDAGRRRYLAGTVPDKEPDIADMADVPAKPDDPLTGGIDRLAKAEPMARILFLKGMGQAVANRPGLALKRVTDKGGHQTQRWTKTGADAPAANKPGAGKSAEPLGSAPASMKHGDVVGFRHGDVQGQGKIVASGEHGVTVHDGEREHQVRHEHLEGPAASKPAVDLKDNTPPVASGAAKTPPGDKPGAPAGATASQSTSQLGGAAGGDGGSGGDDGPVDPDKFDAHSYAALHNDPHITPEKVLAQFPPDTEGKIADVLAKLDSATQTIDTFKVNGEYTAERAAVHEKIFNTFLSPERMAAAKPAPGQKPTFTILGGRGGSGKGWFKNKVFDPNKAIVLDADEIKHMLPEYEGWNAAMVHEESGDLFDAITAMAQQAGLNIVHDATMKTAKKAVKLVQGFKDDGYRVEAHYMYLPPQEAAKRAVERFLGPTKRFVPPGIVLGNTTNESSFDQVKSLADAWSFRDNNVSKGQQPRVISERARDENDTGQPGRDGLPAVGPGDGDKAVSGAGGAGGGDGRQTLGKALAAQSAAQAAGRGVTFAGLALPGLVLFLKAVIPDAAQAGLFDQRVNVSGHTTAAGTFVAPYQASRKKAVAAAEPARPPAMKEHEAAGVAMAARRWAKARTGMAVNEGYGLAQYGHATRQSWSDADQDAIIAQWRKLDGASTTRDVTTMPGAPELVPTSLGLPLGSAYTQEHGRLDTGMWSVTMPGMTEPLPYARTKGEAVHAAQAWTKARNKPA